MSGPLSTARSGASLEKRPTQTLDEWNARVAEKKRADAAAAARRAEDQAALEAAAKAVSSAQFEQWKRRKGTIEIALEVGVRRVPATNGGGGAQIFGDESLGQGEAGGGVVAR
jgi:hypothetical protein